MATMINQRKLLSIKMTLMIKPKAKVNDFIDDVSDISVKQDVLVMVTKNINVREGLCNGTV